MNKEEFNNLEVKDQIDFINKELENKSLTKISEEIKVSRKTLRYRFEKIGYVYDKQSNKYIEKSINKDLDEVNNTINTNVLFEKIKGLERQMKALNEEVNKLKIESKEIGFNEIDVRALEGETVSRCYRINKEVQIEFSKFCKRNSSYKVQDILGTALVEFMEKYK